jgi:glycosyltransferase involved in cell wall biosynthesis
VLLAGTGRDVAPYIASEMKHLLASLRDFKKVFVLVIESDSSDNTIEALEALKSTIPNFDYITLGKLAGDIPIRTERLAHCRNHIVQAVKEDPKYAQVDYVMLSDLDGLNTHLNASSVAQCWNTDIPWDVVTANQLDFYYDVWTLRHQYWSPGDCILQQSSLEPLLGHDQSVNLAVWAKQVQLPTTAGYVEVDAAFGGFAIYKKRAYVTGKYVGSGVTDGVWHEACEHVAHCFDMRKAGYRIFINSALINCKRPADQNPKKPKSFSVAMIRGVRIVGIGLFGKKRFQKYLDLLSVDH